MQQSIKPESYDVFIDDEFLIHCLTKKEAMNTINTVYENKKKSMPDWILYKNQHTDDTIDITGYDRTTKKYKKITSCFINKNINI